MHPHRLFIALSGPLLGRGRERRRPSGLRVGRSRYQSQHTSYYSRSPCYTRTKGVLGTAKQVECAGKYRRRAHSKGLRQGRREVYAEG